jgi:type IV pilus assembly protein PilW
MDYHAVRVIKMNTARPNRQSKRSLSIAMSQAGFSIMEIMISLSVGLVILLGLAVLLSNSVQSQRTMAKDSEQIENGRVALETISQDLRLAGYYDTFYLPSSMPALPSSLPDACATVSASSMYNAMSLYLQLHPTTGPAAKPTLTAMGTGASGCGNFLSAANVVAGSDVVIIRRAATTALSPTTVPTAHQMYLQTGSFYAQIQTGAGSTAIGTTLRADGNPMDDTAPNHQTTVAAADTSFPALTSMQTLIAPVSPATTPTPTAGPIYRYMVRIYFVAPCSVGSGASGYTGIAGVCQAGDDSIPTLKRLDLTPTATGGQWTLSSVAEGIEAMTLDVGVDNYPSTADPYTLLAGDGQPDYYTHAPSIAELSNATAGTLRILAKGSQGDYIDAKKYDMGYGASTYLSFNDRYRRHLYTARVRVENTSQRREPPK